MHPPPLLLILVLTAYFITGVRGLRNVTLQIIPAVAERGKQVELLCHFDLQGAPLYTIKFYRGTHEFYRYTPNDDPHIKLFPFNGLEINLPASQGSSVVISKADYSLAGNVSCEVSTDAPSFSTQTAIKCLTVVELPKKPPDIQLAAGAEAGAEWEPGDTLSATCTSPPARPAPSLSWFINDEPVLPSTTRCRQENGQLESRSVTLSMTLLPRHVVHGTVMVKCTAAVMGVYSETTYLVLGPSTQREPRHERVQSNNSAVSVTHCRVSPGAVVILALALVTR